VHAANKMARYHKTARFQTQNDTRYSQSCSTQPVSGEVARIVGVNGIANWTINLAGDKVNAPYCVECSLCGYDLPQIRNGLSQ